MALVLDTGPLLAALDEDDPDHDACSELLNGDEQLVIPGPVLVELDYWLRKRAPIDVWLTFVEDVAEGAYSLFPTDVRLLNRAGELERSFADQGVGVVDAAVFATCELLGESKVATLDRRHFSVMRTREGSPLELLPA